LSCIFPDAPLRAALDGSYSWGSPLGSGSRRLDGADRASRPVPATESGQHELQRRTTDDDAQRVGGTLARSPFKCRGKQRRGWGGGRGGKLGPGGGDRALKHTRGPPPCSGPPGRARALIPVLVRQLPIMRETPPAFLAPPGPRRAACALVTHHSPGKHQVDRDRRLQGRAIGAGRVRGTKTQGAGREQREMPRSRGGGSKGVGRGGTRRHRLQVSCSSVSAGAGKWGGPRVGGSETRCPPAPRGSRVLCGLAAPPSHVLRGGPEFDESSRTRVRFYALGPGGPFVGWWRERALRPIRCN